MSASQKFSDVKEAEPARLDHIESVLPSLVRLSEYSSLKDIVGSLGQQIKEISLKVSGLSPDISSVKAASDQAHLTLSKQCGTLSSNQVSIHEKISETQALQADHSVRIKKASDALSDIHSKIFALESGLGGYASLNAMKFLSDNFNAFKGRVESLMQESKGPAAMSMNMIGDLRKEVASLASMIDAYAKRYDETKASIAVVKDSLTTERKSMMDYVDKAILASHNTLHSKIDAIPAPTPSISLAEVKKAILDALEPVSLDAKNAALRSANSDMKVAIIEKKLEQVMLLAKRFELNQ